MGETMSAPTRLLAAVALLAAAGMATAQDALDDPTRPPAALSAPAASGVPAAAGLPDLQSILVSQRPGGRRVAVIDGKPVRQGQRVGDAILETIRPTEVVLKRGRQRVTLKLFRPPESAAAAQP